MNGPLGNRQWLVQKLTTSQRSENTCQWNIQPHMRHFHHLSLRPRDHHGRRNRKSLQAIDWEDWSKAVSSRHDKALALTKSQQIKPFDTLAPAPNWGSIDCCWLLWGQPSFLFENVDLLVGHTPLDNPYPWVRRSKNYTQQVITSQKEGHEILEWEAGGSGPLRA